MATLNYECPNCGGPLKFNPDKQMFSCEYCFSDFSEQQIQQLFAEKEKKETQDEREIKHDEANKAEAKAQGFDADGEYAVTYTCPTCGAEVVTTETTAATTCYYCQNPVVLGGRLSEEFKPDRVVPFALTKDKAIEKFLEMCGKKKFLPIGFAGKKQFEKLQGVYFPYWYVDEKSQASMVATGKKVRRWSSGNRNYTETSTYRLFRTGDMFIKNVFELALNSNGKKLFEKELQNNNHEMLQCVHPFDLSKARPFAMSYLSGFQAEKRDLDKKDVAQTVASRMDEYAKRLLENTMSEYQNISVESFNDKQFEEVWNYTLLPVWIVTYQYNGEILPFAINGQTGKTYGKLPVAMGKLTGVAAIVAAIVFILCLLGGLLIL